MQVVAGGWMFVVGVMAALAGLAGLRRTRRLRRCGESAWATVVPAVTDDSSEAGRSPRRVMVQFALPDGRVVEQLCPRPARAADPEPGQKILVWYDPGDPSDVLVYRRDGRSDVLFVAAGGALLVAGIVLAVFGG
jgi:Protein of unknown function (DUF3592)